MKKYYFVLAIVLVFDIIVSLIIMNIRGEKMKNKNIAFMTQAAMIAAIYVVLT